MYFTDEDWIHKMVYFSIDLADVEAIVNSLIIFRLILKLRMGSVWTEGLALNVMKAINHMLN